MSKPDVIEVSLVFRGKDALENSQAFILYLDSVKGIWSIVEGIGHFGGAITQLSNDLEQNIFYFDGDL